MDMGLWTATMAACGLLAIWGRHERRMPLHWGFKPLPVILLILAVLDRTPPGDARTLIITALGLSLVGDVVLMLPKKIFAIGLASFLLALVAYTVAFSIDVPPSIAHLPLLFVPLLPGALVLRTLWPHVGRLRPAVVVYVVAMALLVWRLLVRYDGDATVPSYLLAVAGGVVFMLADSLLALRRFAGWKVPYPLELGPYFVAQWCLAASTWT